MTSSLLKVVVLLSGLFFTSFSAFGSQDGGSDAIVGKWVTAEDKSVVEIYRSGKSYCLKIVSLKDPFNEDGTKKVDENNPDLKKRTDDIIGLVIGSGFEFKGDSSWDGGSIYDPDNGKSYSCKINLEGDKLKVRGFIGVALFGRSEIWKRR